MIVSNLPKTQIDEFSRIMTTKDRIEQEDFYSLKGSFLSIVTSQNGSRLMQRVYTSTSRNILEQIFIELLAQLCSLMIDPYANYFCQKFYLILSQESKLKYLNQLSLGIIQIAKSKIGTHSCQTVVSLLKSKEEKEIIVQSLSGHVLDLCNDAMGVHLIEKIVVCFEEDLIVEVYDTIITNFTVLAHNANGLFVCKKVIVHAKNFSTLARIRDVIKENSMKLIKNQYGNYTIQVAIDNWPCELCQPIIESFNGNVFNLSMEKYSSNVIEKCLERSDEKQLLNFIEEITKNNCIISLMKNSFGNYVMQKILKLVNGKTKAKLVSIIKKSIEKLNDTKLIAKWKGILSHSNHLSFGNNLGIGRDNLNNSGIGSVSGSGSLDGSFNTNHSPKNKKNKKKEKLSRSYNNSPLIGQSTILSPIMGNVIINSPIMVSTPFINMNNIQKPKSPIASSSNRFMINNLPISNSFLQYPINQLSLQQHQIPVQQQFADQNTQLRFYPPQINFPSHFQN